MASAARRPADQVRPATAMRWRCCICAANHHIALPAQAVLGPPFRKDGSPAIEIRRVTQALEPDGLAASRLADRELHELFFAVGHYRTPTLRTEISRPVLLGVAAVRLPLAPLGGQFHIQRVTDARTSQSPFLALRPFLSLKSSLSNLKQLDRQIDGV